MDTKLATIVCGDVVSYSKLMQQDEAGTLANLDRCRTIIDGLVIQHRGRIFNTGGDSILAEFGSAVDAVKFALDMQARMHTEQTVLTWRVGIHAGEVWLYGSNLMGDTVNLAARIESLADYGGVTVSDTVYRLVRPKLSNIEFESRGQQTFKNVEPMEIWSAKLPYARANPNLITNDTTNNQHQQNLPVKSPAAMIADIESDRAAKNRTITDAQYYINEHRYEPAIRIIMWRILKQSDPLATELLIKMFERKIIPTKFLPYVFTVIHRCASEFSSDHALKLSHALESIDNLSLATQILEHASQVNPGAALRLAELVLNNNFSTKSDRDTAVANLIESGRRRDIASMILLGKYYIKQQNAAEAFKWLYAARAEKSQQAHDLLEQLTKNISRADFANYQTAANALIDEIKFIGTL